MSLLAFICLYIISVYSNEESMQAKCHMTPAYPPPNDRLIGSYVINLDDNASQRWVKPTNDFKDDIANVVDLTMGAWFMTPFRARIDSIGVDNLLKRLPYDWGNEIISIANIINRSRTDVYLYNLAYSLMGFCTSIVAQDNDGNIFHGRNLDFGLWPAVNWTDWQWDLTTDLKKILFEANFTKNGQVLYRTITYGGFIGVHTGVKPNGFSLSVDTRFDNNFDRYLEKYWTDPNDNNQLLVMATRYMFENYNHYDDAIGYISQLPMVCPAYVIMGGINNGEGVVMTYGPNMTLFDKWEIKNALPNMTNINNFYVLETNYDHWDEPPIYDDRRYPAEQCMDEIGQKGVGFYSLYNVLNGLPNRNRLTTFTSLMSAKQDGYIQAWKQYCDVPECSPW